MRVLTAAIFLALTAVPASAFDYPCPSDPGFCYFDVADDGCFDPGTDDGPIDDLLGSGGTYPGPVPPHGSIVCPPSVKKIPSLRPPGTVDVSWKTAPGSDILIHAANLSQKSGNVRVVSGNRLLLGGKVSVGDWSFQAEVAGDFELEGSIRGVTKQFGGSIIIDVEGNAVLHEKSKLIADGVILDVAGDVTAHDRFRGSGLVVTAGGRLEMTNPKLSGNVVQLTANDVLVHGRGDLKASKGAARIEITATGDITADALKLSGEEISVAANALTVGQPDGSGTIAASKIKGIRLSQADRTIEITTPNGLTLRKATLLAQQIDLVASNATNVVITSSRLRGVSPLDQVNLSTGPGSI